MLFVVFLDEIYMLIWHARGYYDEIYLYFSTLDIHVCMVLGISYCCYMDKWILKDQYPRSNVLETSQNTRFGATLPQGKLVPMLFLRFWYSTQQIQVLEGFRSRQGYNGGNLVCIWHGWMCWISNRQADWAQAVCEDVVRKEELTTGKQIKYRQQVEVQSN